MKSLTWIITILVCLTSCSSNELNEKEWIAFAQSDEVDFHQSKTIDDIEFIAFLKPYQVICLMRHMRDDQQSTITDTECKSLAGDFMVFDFEVNVLNPDDQRYQGPIIFTSKDFSLHTPDGESIPCGLIHQEPSNRLGANRMSLAFDTANVIRNQEYLTLSLRNDQLKTGDIRFQFETAIINDAPKLKTTNI